MGGQPWRGVKCIWRQPSPVQLQTFTSTGESELVVQSGRSPKQAVIPTGSGNPFTASTAGTSVTEGVGCCMVQTTYPEVHHTSAGCLQHTNTKVMEVLIRIKKGISQWQGQAIVTVHTYLL
jgi:hypothetical protein